MKHAASILALFACFALAPASLSAQEVDAGNGVTFQKPDGWVQGKKKKGCAASLSAAGDKKSQIELRYTPDVPREKAKQYFGSFHTNLQAAGLVKKAEGASRKFGELEGVLTEYDTKGKKSVLYVFEFHHAGGAWMVTGMFSVKNREAYFADYEKLVSGLKLK